MTTKTTLGLMTALALTAVIVSTAATIALADAGHQHGTAGQAAYDFGMPGKATEVTRTIELKAGDNFYEPESVQVKAGETVRFVIKNEGKLVHDFTLGTPDMHDAHQKEMRLMVEHGVLAADKIHYDKMKMDMGGGKTMEHNDPNSTLLAPGKTGEIIWKFTKAMNLEFACNVPGHYQAGMMGTVQVSQ